MKTDKRTFVFHLEWAQILKGQSDEIRLAVFDAIMNYIENGEAPEPGSAVYMAFLFIKQQIDKDAEKYAEVCEKRAMAGKKHKGNQYTNKRNKTEQMKQMFQNGTNGTDNDNEYDYDNNTTINSSDIINTDKSVKKTKPAKKVYGKFENVKLTDDEATKLHEEFGEDAIGIVDFLSAYRAEKGYKNKSDYLSIKRWVANAYFEQLSKKQHGNYNNPNSNDYITTERIVAAGFAMAKAGI